MSAKSGMKILCKFLFYSGSYVVRPDTGFFISSEILECIITKESFPFPGHGRLHLQYFYAKGTFLHFLHRSSETAQHGSISVILSQNALLLNYSSCRIDRVSFIRLFPTLSAINYKDSGSETFSTPERYLVVKSLAAVFESGQ